MTKADKDQLRKALSYLASLALGNDYSDGPKVEYAEWLIEDALDLSPDPLGDGLDFGEASA